MKEKIKHWGTQKGIAIGICDAEYDTLLKGRLEKEERLLEQVRLKKGTWEKRVNPRLTMDSVQSIIVCIFPYYRKDFVKTNLSRYACTQDYHRVAKQMMGELAEYIETNLHTLKYKMFVDNGPLVDRHLAYKAGLGFWGKNQQLIHPRFGSYFFIGYLLTDLKISPDQPLYDQCMGCEVCIASCPQKALKEDFGFEFEKCISYLTQKKELTYEEKQAVFRCKMVFGCDICQEVCPHNQDIEETKVEGFCLPLLKGLEYEEIAKLSNREFAKKYAHYPFAWRGKKTLLKNFSEE